MGAAASPPPRSLSTLFALEDGDGQERAHLRRMPSGTSGRPQQTVHEYCEVLAQSRKSVRTSAEVLFPMYVVAVPDLLQMRVAEPHQVLKAKGMIEEYDRDMGVAAFVSHQWCSQNHPDPDFAQLSLLQGVLRRLTSGELQLETDLFSRMVFNSAPTVKLKDLQPLAWGLVWYDYFAVPQPGVPMAESDQHTNLDESIGRAVFSIPAYVDACQFFIVLAPPVPHAGAHERLIDYQTWKQRGWCRLERAARVLSPKHTHMLLAKRMETLVQVGSQDYLWDAVGEGLFSVEQDRARLAPIVMTMLECKLQALLQQRDLHRYRHLLSVRSSLLRGLPGVSPLDCFAPGFVVPRRAAAGADTLRAFLRLYGFEGPDDRAGGSTEPILLAARSGDHDAVRALLCCRANVNAREGANDSERSMARGFTPLHVAGVAGADAELLQLLLEFRADLEARTANGITPLMCAALGGCEHAVAALLKARASPAAKEPFGGTALHAAAIGGRVGACAQLVAAGASAAPDRDGASPLLWAAIFGGGGDTIEALLAAPDTNTETCFSPGALSPVGMLVATLALPSRLWGSRATLPFFAHEVKGSTPLLAAAIMGNLGEAQALIEGCANPLARNARGRSAVQLGELAGLMPRSVCYFRDLVSVPQAQRTQSRAEPKASRTSPADGKALERPAAEATQDVVEFAEPDDEISSQIFVSEPLQMSLWLADDGQVEPALTKVEVALLSPGRADGSSGAPRTPCSPRTPRSGPAALPLFSTAATVSTFL